MRFPGFTEEWEAKKLGEITSWSSGGTPPKDNPLFWNGDIPWISASSMRGIVYSDSDLKITQIGLKRGSKLAPKGTLLILVRGSMLFNKIPIGIVSKDVAFNQDVKSIRVNDYSTSEYILNWFMASESKILNMVTGTGIGAGKLDLTDLKALEIKIPSLAEQIKIASFLSLINDRIQTQNKIIQQLESLMQCLRDKFFKQQIKFKDENGHNFPNWEDKKLGEVLIKNSNKNKGQKHSLVQSVSNKHGFINQEEMFEDRRIASKETSNYYVIEKGHFAYNPSRIDVGSLAYKANNEISIISPLYISFSTNKKFLKDNYLLNWFSSEQFTKQMDRSFEGSVRNTLSYESLTTIRIHIPCLKEQVLISNYLTLIKEKMEIERRILQQLENQKKYLLSNLFI